MRYPNFREEKKLYKKGFEFIAGIDEAGRGALAGPVVAAAAMIRIKKQGLRIKDYLNSVKDSKQLTPKRREKIYNVITKDPNIIWSVGVVSEKVIDKINILEATKLAMKKAVNKLKQKPDFLLIDGTKGLQGEYRIYPRKSVINGKIRVNQRSIKKADEKIISCAAASIIAKVTRDRMMLGLHKKYPQYGFDRHKGYGTKLHFETIKKHGSCNFHRKTFRPICMMSYEL